jgi:hypothetical protein
VAHLTAYAELQKEPVIQVKLLGVSLALYRSPNGDMGLMSVRCSQRRWRDRSVR